MKDERLFEKAAIIGVGLIGGSLARVLKNRGLAGRVVGSGRSEANMKKALELGIIDEALPLEKAVKNADIVVLCGPVLSILPTLEKAAAYIKDGSLVTDVGSTKSDIAYGAEKISAGRFSFIGSHPIAGTEKSGAENSFETLFDRHRCIITPLDNAPVDAYNRLVTLWQKAGMEVLKMRPDRHDKIFSAVSHLPHMVVYALVNAVCEISEGDDIVNFAAGGFKDFTRIASSPAEMWADIALSNAKPIADQLSAVKNHISEIESAIKQNDKERLLGIFKKSNAFRKKLT